VIEARVSERPPVGQRLSCELRVERSEYGDVACVRELLDRLDKREPDDIVDLVCPAAIPAIGVISQ
jgi:hypothetical protein